MRLRKLNAALCGLWAWAVAGVAFAAGEPWQPNSDLFKLNFRFASLALLLTAAAIGIGLLAAVLFRIRKVRLNLKTGAVQRHSTGHVLMHWVNAGGFLLATFTGAVMLKWIPVTMEMGLLYTLHFIGAGAILMGFVSTAVHATTKGTTSRHRLIPTGHQIRETFIELLAYAGLVGDRGILGFRQVQLPTDLRRSVEKSVGFQGFGRTGKYLAAEEVLSYPLWALVGLAIIGSGILKSIRYAYALPPAVVKWTTIIHDWAAVATLVMLAAHVGALVLVRTNWPLLASMFTSKVSVAHVKEVHGAWYDELVKEADKAGSGKVAASAQPGRGEKGMGHAGR